MTGVGGGVVGAFVFVGPPHAVNSLIHTLYCAMSAGSGGVKTLDHDTLLQSDGNYVRVHVRLGSPTYADVLKAVGVCGTRVVEVDACVCPGPEPPYTPPPEPPRRARWRIPRKRPRLG